MINLLESASKVVFILMAVAVVTGMFIGKIDSKDFMMLAGMAFTFYFSYKGTDKVESSNTSTEPFAGK
jgi:uncharacterized membrane protein AbrB (regulator of aidB expression)